MAGKMLDIQLAGYNGQVQDRGSVKYAKQDYSFLFANDNPSQLDKMCYEIQQQREEQAKGNGQNLYTNG